MRKPTPPKPSGKIFSAAMAALAVCALVGTIWTATSGDYNPAAPVLAGGVTLGFAALSAAPWFPRRDE